MCIRDRGYTINRPPRDGHMAFVKSPDKISIEILQEGNLPPKESPGHQWKILELGNIRNILYIFH